MVCVAPLLKWTVISVKLETSPKVMVPFVPMTSGAEIAFTRFASGERHELIRIAENAAEADIRTIFQKLRLCIDFLRPAEKSKGLRGTAYTPRSIMQPAANFGLKILGFSPSRYFW